MGMARFLQFQDKPAKVQWSVAAQSNPVQTAATCSSSRRSDIGQPSRPGDALLEGALIALKRFLAQRDDARSWLPAVGNGKSAHPSPSAGGAVHGTVPTPPAAQAGARTSSPRYGSSVWGCWL